MARPIPLRTNEDGLEIWGDTGQGGLALVLALFPVGVGIIIGFVLVI